MYILDSYSFFFDGNSLSKVLQFIDGLVFNMEMKNTDRFMVLSNQVTLVCLQQ